MKEKMSDILGSVFLTIFGVCLVAWADSVTNILSIVIGLAFAFFGIIRIINYYKNREICNTFDLIFAIILLVIGGVLIFRANFLKEMISFIVGIYIVLASINGFINALSIYNSSGHKMNKPMIMYGLCLVIGILCILGKFILPDLILQFIGILMTVYGVMSIISTLLVVSEKDDKESSKMSNKKQIIEIKDVKEKE